MKQQKFRQIFLVLICILFSISSLKAQDNNSKIDYSARSNILHPDTLKGDQKAVFWCFVELSSKETEELDPLIVKEEFAGIGITTEDNDRFVDAYIFFKTYCIGHKKSCEQWEYFKFLKPE